MTLRELGAVFGSKDYAAVCMGLRRFDQRMKKNRTRKELTEMYERVRQILYV
jgi:chromosomal replication initiation ATPase DnaA